MIGRILVSLTASALAGSSPRRWSVVAFSRPFSREDFSKRDWREEGLQRLQTHQSPEIGSGQFTQIGSQTPYKFELVIGPRGTETTYPDLDCTGTLTRIGASNGLRTYTIWRRKESCKARLRARSA
jgi:hypothetical protein